MISRRPLTAEEQVRSQPRPRDICGGRSGTARSFSPCTSLLPRKYHPVSECSIIITTCMLLLPERQSGEDWKPALSVERVGVGHPTTDSIRHAPTNLSLVSEQPTVYET